MQVYKGNSRRQVGGSIWSTSSRGIKSFFDALIKNLKPQAKDLGKKLASQAAKSAVNITSNLASDAILGKLNKDNVKSAFVDEMQHLKGEAEDALHGFKRKMLNDDNDGLEQEQVGEGVKRRKMSKKSYKRKKGNKQKKGYKQKKGNKKVKRRTKRSSKVDIDIFGN